MMSNYWWRRKVESTIVKVEMRSKSKWKSFFIIFVFWRQHPPLRFAIYLSARARSYSGPQKLPALLLVRPDNCPPRDPDILIPDTNIIRSTYACSGNCPFTIISRPHIRHTLPRAISVDPWTHCFDRDADVFFSISLNDILAQTKQPCSCQFEPLVYIPVSSTMVLLVSVHHLAAALCYRAQQVHRLD